MDFFIKRIFNGISDEKIHLQFQKFSRGKFEGKALVSAKKSKDMYSIATGPEYANELVSVFGEMLGSQKTQVTGVIVSTMNLDGKFEFKNKKQFMGVKQYVIEGEMTGKEIKDICDKFTDCFIALSFSVGENTLKIKAKAPKSAKPGSGDKEPVADFCKIKTRDVRIAEGLLFGVGEFKQVDVKHVFQIEDIILPAVYNSPDELRKLAKRSGKIIREANVDGKITKTEKSFVA